MKHLIIILLAVGFANTAHGGEKNACRAWTGAALFDGTGEALVTNATLVIEGGRITNTGPGDKVVVPKGCVIVDAKGRWIIPGLVDAHIHWFQSGGLYTRPDIIDLSHMKPYREEQREIFQALPVTFKRWLASGVTAVVDVGGPFWNFLLADRAVAAVADDDKKKSTPQPVEHLRPRIATAGPLISTVSREILALDDPPIIKASTPEEARALVRKQLPHKPDLIKIWYVLDDPKRPRKNLWLAAAVIDEAHKAGVRVAVHAMQLEAARAVVEAGADILVHSIDDKPVDDAFIKLLKEKGVILTTTLVVLEGYGEVLGRRLDLMPMERRLGDPEVIESWNDLDAVDVERFDPKRFAKRTETYRKRIRTMQANLKRLHEAGVVIAAGTDAGNIGTLHGPSLHRELELIVEAGVSPQDALVMATRNAARVFAEKPDFGVLKPGNRADFLVLTANPLANIRNARRIHRVIKGGHVLNPNELIPPAPEAVAQGQLEAYNARDLDAFLAWYADDVEIYSFPGGPAIMKGRKAMQKAYKKLFEASPELNCVVQKRMVLGGTVIDHELVNGHRGRARIRAIAVYSISDGLIRKVWFIKKQ